MTPAIDTHPKVKLAHDNLQACRKGLEKAEQAISRTEMEREAAARGAARAIANGKKPQRLDALPDHQTFMAAVHEHREAINLAEKSLQDAILEAKRDALADLQSEHMAAVKTLHSKLAAAAETNATVRAIEAQAQQLRVNGSSALPRLSWHELGEESPSRASKLASWTRSVEKYLGPIGPLAKTRKRLGMK